MSERPAPSLLVFGITWVVPLCLRVYTADDIYEICWRFTQSLDIAMRENIATTRLPRVVTRDDFRRQPTGIL